MSQIPPGTSLLVPLGDWGAFHAPVPGCVGEAVRRDAAVPPDARGQGQGSGSDQGSTHSAWDLGECQSSLSTLLCC